MRTAESGSYAAEVEADRRGGLRRRITRALSGSRELVQIVYRDPEHVAERLTLYAGQSLGEQSREWAESAREARPGADRAEIAEELRIQSARIARIDGAVSGTPFLIALVPGYMNYLWQEARMSLRIAALYGRDATALTTASEMLALRGVHPTPEAAEKALLIVRDGPLPAKPDSRRPLAMWIRSGWALLIFGGFLSAPDEESARSLRHLLRGALGFLIAGVVWVITWVLPLTFMIAMAWSCEAHTRQLGRRAQAFYGGEAASAPAAIGIARRHHDRGHDRRQWIRGVALGLSVAIPMAFVVYVNHVRQTVGVSWLGALGALVALSMVLATAVIAARH